MKASKREEAAMNEANVTAIEHGHLPGPWEGAAQRIGNTRWEMHCTKCNGVTTVQVDSAWGLPDIIGPQLMEEKCK